MSSNLIQEKVSQAFEILREQKIDAWLTFTRETSAGGDPVLPLIYGHHLTWQSALILTMSGESFAIVGAYEAETARRTGAYTTVIPYHQSLRRSLLHTLERIDPGKIAINYSKSDVLADGLGHGLYQLLLDYFLDTPWEQRLVSAEGIIRALRGRKTTGELDRIRAAAETTRKIYARTFDYLRPGLSELEISAFMHEQLQAFGVEAAWEYEHCPVVNAGPASPLGHIGPSDIRIQHGQLLSLDFGVRQDGYCSDIQRTVYFLAPGETHPPDEVQRGFDTVVHAIQKTAQSIQPGMLGKEADAIARSEIAKAGYDEFKYATGHQVGRLAHDGAGILGPEWERYGDTPNYPIEVGQVYTLEPGLAVPGYGYIGLEEMIVIKESGVEFLCEPQLKMVIR